MTKRIINTPRSAQSSINPSTYGRPAVFPIQEYEIAPYAAGVQYVRIALDSQS